MKFRPGDSIKVKQGVKYPTFEVELDCCQGRVSEVYDNEVVCIDFDSHTLKRMPDSQIKKCEREGWAWHQINLGSNELELATPRDTQAEVKKILEKMSEKFANLIQSLLQKRQNLFQNLRKARRSNQFFKRILFFLIYLML